MDADKILLRKSRNCVFIARLPAGKLVGLLEASLRDYAEECKTSPVGYIEGWYVEPKYRRSGIGRALVHAAERWALSKGCSEMASDALIENRLSHKVHRALDILIRETWCKGVKFLLWRTQTRARRD